MQRRCSNTAQGISRPSSCNFTRGVSHTPTNQDNLNPISNGPAAEEHEQPHEEHNQPVGGDNSTQAPSLERSDVVSSNASRTQQPKLLIGVEGGGVHLFKECICKAAYAKMKDIVHGHYTGAWTSINKVPDAVKNMWFQEFEKHFYWTESREMMRKVFLFEAGKHISNVFNKNRAQKRRPDFVAEEFWSEMEEIRNIDPNMLRQAQVNKENRNTERALDTGAYRGGSKKVSKWMKSMEKRDGTKPKISKVVCELWAKTDGSGMHARPAKIVAEFERLEAKNNEQESPSSKLNETQLWVQACKGPRNGRIFGLSDEGTALVCTGTFDSSSSEPLTSAFSTQDQLQPFNDELKDMREEMKTLRSQNEEILNQNKGLHEMLRQFMERQGGNVEGASTTTSPHPTP